jgi:hypothetical protein
MPLGARQLFIYWRAATRDVAPALEALRAWQRALCAGRPTLSARNYLRADAVAGTATVMESYALDAPQPAAGIDAALQRQIEDEGTAALQPWLCGARHVEVFDALADA